MSLTNIFVDLRKLDEEQRIVEGFATTEEIDRQPGMWKGQRFDGDLIPSAAVAEALPNYMEWANLREMHLNSAVGTVLKAEVIEGEVEVDGRVYRNPVHIVAKIVDDDAWKKVKEGVYKGFSIGGAALEAAIEKVGKYVARVIKRLTLIEISLVDRPANPGARILLWKVETGGDEVTTELEEVQAGVENHADEPVGEAEQPDAGGVDLEKIAATHEKALGMLQSLRDDLETNGDLDGAARYSQAIALLVQSHDAPESDESMDDDPETGESAAQGAAEASGDLNLAAQAELREGVETPESEPFDLEKAVQGVLQSEAIAKLLPALESVERTLSGLSERIETLERQPQDGGPMLRPVEKSLGAVTPQNGGEEETPAAAGKSIADLKRLSNTAPDPVMKAEYTRQLWLAEQKTVKR